MRTEVYVDTSAFIAFLDLSEAHHDLFARLFSDPPRLVTTTLVIAEGHAWFLKRYDRRRALRFLSFIDDLAPLRVTAVGEDELRGARRYVDKFADQDLTLTDAVGLLIQRRHAVRVCWSTDRHLALTGVPLVIHERG